MSCSRGLKRMRAMQWRGFARQALKVAPKLIVLATRAERSQYNVGKSHSYYSVRAGRGRTAQKAGAAVRRAEAAGLRLGFLEVCAYRRTPGECSGLRSV